LSALFGRNVICSSATISLPVATAIDTAYKSGIQMAAELEAYDGSKPTREIESRYIRCLIDNYLEPQIALITAKDPDFQDVYSERLKAMMDFNASQPVYREARLIEVKELTVQNWMEAVGGAIEQLHRLNQWAFNDTKSLSFGLVRVANIKTAILLSRYLSDRLPQAKIACYHSADFIISRFFKESYLDRLLKRSSGDSHIINDLGIKIALQQSRFSSVPFVVVATPVEEIGRDHDFDWAVIDVSSAQSIVQTAGRVNRHRLKVLNEVENLAIPRFNYRHCLNHEAGNTQAAAFIWPGYEGQAQSLKRHSSYKGHDLSELLPWLNSRLAVTANLRFDHDSCLLAKADDESIAKIIKEYFGSGGYFVINPSDAWLLSTGPYMQTPLRARDAPQAEWRARFEEGEAIYERKRRVLINGRVVDRWLEASVKISPKKPNSWLSLDLAEMVELCTTAGIDPLDGLKLQITTYSESDGLEYDAGFGFMRLI
jgi:CRISPR-associated endonuclease/helicase Cas3